MVEASVVFTLVQIFILLTVFQLKHFIADYFLQSEYMLKKFLPGWGFALPLATHCAVHALFTLAICLLVSPGLWWLAIVDFIVHFVMDRFKAGPKYLGRFKPLFGADYVKAAATVNGNIDWNSHPWESRNTEEAQIATLKTLKYEANRKLHGNKFFWRSLGFDQMIHHITHYAIIGALVL